MYDWVSETETWSTVGNVVTAGQFFGRHATLSADGTRYIVNNNLNNWAVKVYGLSTTTNLWTQVGTDVNLGYRFSQSVSLSKDGNDIAIANGIDTVATYRWNAATEVWDASGKVTSPVTDTTNSNVQFTTRADMTNDLNNQYFADSGDLESEATWLIWYNVNTGGSEPTNSAGVVIEVALATNDDAETVATKTRDTINTGSDTHGLVATGTANRVVLRRMNTSVDKNMVALSNTLGFTVHINHLAPRRHEYFGTQISTTHHSTVHINGDYLIVGATDNAEQYGQYTDPYDVETGYANTGGGCVYIYKRSASDGQWQLFMDPIYGTKPQARKGIFSVSRDGTRIAIGSRDHVGDHDVRVWSMAGTTL